MTDAMEMLFGPGRPDLDLKDKAKTLMNNNMNDFIEALQEISEAKGAFKRDPHEHAKSCIRDMQTLARDVLIKHGIEPRGQPVDER